MTVDHIKPEDLEWKCFRCDQPLVAESVIAIYLGNNITTQLPQCPTCHSVLVSEELAVGKIAEVEKLLENK
ncbi:conserved hypothetical protein [Desulfosarcina cetonica]|uniref:DVU_1557 family redox protein n=1 Tax=Desulfosarcina cetonica TaxID=90730 RepID=UPI0006CF2029|nr:CLJU_RS11820 family redox protein [Desulfosarcina cetonica]VTR67729.1 conserved hypothetical protein [Desulfosarcina cetonica]